MQRNRLLAACFAVAMMIVFATPAAWAYGGKWRDACTRAIRVCNVLDYLVDWQERQIARCDQKLERAIARCQDRNRPERCLERAERRNDRCVSKQAFWRDWFQDRLEQCELRRGDACCGNGTLEVAFEECDDGNIIDEDGCSATCVLEICGDGVVQPALGEECDDGVNDGTPGTCNPDCTIAPTVTPGRMYIADFSTNRVYRADLDGSDIEEVIEVTGTFGPRGIAIDPEMEQLYITVPKSFGSTIQRAGLDGSGLTELLNFGFATGKSPNHIALDLAGDKMYWTQFASPNLVRRANLDGTGVEDVVTSGIRPIPNGLALDLAAGNLYFTGNGDDRIERTTLEPGGPRTFIVLSTGNRDLQSVALDLTAGHVYWTDNVGNGQFGSIKRADLDGRNKNVVTLVPATGPRSIFGLALDLNAGKMYWTERLGFGSPGGGAVKRANLDGTEVETLLDDTSAILLGSPYTIALDLCGDGLISVSQGEQCDDGNLTDGDGCSAECRVE